MKKFFLILLMALAVVSATSQKAVVESFEVAPMDVTAQKYARLDLHGEKCALVKVIVVAQNVSFQGNLIGDVPKKGSEYWVYLTAGTKMMRITADNFMSMMYNFPEPLQGGVTYILTLQTPQNFGIAPQKPAENYLVLKVNPAHATVFVDGAPKSVEDGVVSVSLPDGPHTYRVELVGYAAQEGTVTMAGKRESRTISLVSTKPTLTITAATPGTEIYINDARKGTGRWSGQLFPDTYVVEGRLAAHRTHTQKITLTEGRDQTLAIPALAAITGSLNVNYKPVDATITVDGRNAGVTPNVVRDLLVGDHTVVISKNGYTPATLTATVTEDATTVISGSLSPVPADPLAADIALTRKYQPFRDDASGKYGYKLNGTVVIPPKYDNAWDFANALATVQLNGKWGFVDKNGTMVIPAKYDRALNFSEDLAPVKINGKYGFIDKTDTMVIPARYESALMFCDGLAPVVINNRWGYIDKSGAVAITPRYESAHYFTEGLATVQINNKYGFIDKTGTLVIPALYDFTWFFHEGLVQVKINGKCGFIDRKGEMVIPAIYDDSIWTSFSNGTVEVSLNGRRFLIDRNGNEVPE